MQDLFYFFCDGAVCFLLDLIDFFFNDGNNDAGSFWVTTAIDCKLKQDGAAACFSCNFVLRNCSRVDSSVFIPRADKLTVTVNVCLSSEPNDNFLDVLLRRRKAGNRNTISDTSSMMEVSSLLSPHDANERPSVPVASKTTSAVVSMLYQIATKNVGKVS